MRQVIGHVPSDGQSYTKVLLLSDDDSTRLFPCCSEIISYTCKPQCDSDSNILAITNMFVYFRKATSQTERRKEEEVFVAIFY